MRDLPCSVSLAKTRPMGGLLLAVLLAGCPAVEADDDLGPMQTDCSEEGEKVGWTAELETFAHDVSGRAEIVDACTLSIPDFTYDGEGVDVRFFVADGGDFSGGQAISEDILGQVYDGEPLTLTLPESVSFDEITHLSVWCVAFSADFGSGQFEPPPAGR